MKQIYTLLFFAVILCSNVFAQYFTWQWQNSQPYGYSLHRSLILPNGTYMLFGENSTVLKSTNQGLTWVRTTPDSLNGYRRIYGAHFVDDNTGYICGESGMIYKTTNGGSSWNSQNSGVTTNLLEITFYDANLGIAGGSSQVILKTTDGGNNWTPISTSATSGEVYRIVFAPGTNGSVVYMGSGLNNVGRVSKSTDGGSTWIQAPGYTSTVAVRGIDFIDADTGYAANGVYAIYKTTNGGQTFNIVYDQAGVFYDLKILSPGTIAAVGSRGECIKSTDWGTTWQLYNTMLNSTVYTFAERDNNLISAGTGGVMSKSIDLGNSWSLMSKTATVEELRNIQFVSSQTGFAVGGSTSTGVVIKTTDGGENWFPLTFSTNYRMRSQYWFDGNKGFLGNRGPYLYKTTDGGLNFDSVYIGNISATENWNAIAFANADTGYLVGDGGNYFRSTDGGSTWTIIDSTLHHGFSIIYDIAVLNARTLVTVGAAGKIFKTTDGGLTFSDFSSIGSSAIYGLHFLNDSKGFIANSNGGIYKTTDGGMTWFLVMDFGTPTLYSVRAVTENIVWVSGSSGIVSFTTDGGTSWTISQSYPINSRTIYGLGFFDTHLWTVGATGTIIKGFVDPVPVELISFTANIINGEAILNWQTATETNNKGFEIQKRSKNKNSFTNIGFVPGSGTTTGISSYEFRDKISGTAVYRLKQIDYNGSFNYSNEIEVSADLQMTYSLEQNYPNPFNPSTTISFEIPRKEFVTLKLYDILGNLVKVFLSEEKDAGRYTLYFTSDGLASGLYIYKLSAGSFSQSRKMLLVK